MKKALAMILVVVMCLALVACGSSNTPSTPSTPSTPDAPSTPDTPSTPVNDGKVYTIDIDFPNPETASAFKALKDWEAYCEEKSNGRLEITIYSGGALGSLFDCVSNCESGVTDGFWSGVTIYPGVFPATEVMALPMMGAKNFQVVNAVLNDLVANYDVISSEWDQFKVIALHSSAGSPIIFKDDIGSIENMAGLSLRISNAYTTKWFSDKGANPVSLGINDGYENISKNVISGGLFFFDQVESSALYEVIDSIYVGEVMYPLNMLCLNGDVYASLPDDLKAIIDESSEFFLEASVGYFDDQVTRMTAILEENNVNIITETAESRAWLAEGVEASWAEWVNTMNANGYDGQAILDEALRLIEKYNAELG